MGDALKPLNQLDAKAREEHSGTFKAHKCELELHKLKVDEARIKARDALKKGLEARAFDVAEPEEPKARRYVINDTTYEALGEILSDNPNGVLAFRDELVSLLKSLDREEYATARGFFLTAWNGTSSYTFDRIMRGKTHINAACLSLLGSTQPGRLAEYIRRASDGGAGDDGLVQRFSLLVWPDQSPEWRNVDGYPDSHARSNAWHTFDRLDKLDPNAIRAERDKFDEALPFLRFDDRAQADFIEWLEALEKRLRAKDMAPAFESHLAKYRKLVPSLALINHVAEGKEGSIQLPSLHRALAIAEYLETHARRAYGAGPASDAAAANLIIARIRKGGLKDGFALRDMSRKHWSGLSDDEQIRSALALLEDHDWIAQRPIVTAGRPKVEYVINPGALR
jgi:putative DNA primase/helicase